MSKKPYLDYQKSKHWKILKKQALKYFQSKCCWCGKYEHTKLTLHHLNYDHFYSEIIGRDVIIICAGCHIKHHNPQTVCKKKSTHIITVSQKAFDTYPKWNKFYKIVKIKHGVLFIQLK